MRNLLLSLPALVSFAEVNAFVQLSNLDESFESSYEPEPATSEVVDFINSLPVVDQVMTAVGKVKDQEPELFEMLFAMGNMTQHQHFRDRFKHYTGEDIGAQKSPSYTIIPQADGGSGERVGYVSINRDSGSPDHKDQVCSNHCTNTNGCEYWIRATNGEGCWLMKRFRGASNNLYRRLGISNNNGAKCRLAKVVAKQANKWLAENPLSDPSKPPQFQMMHLQLPTDFDCVAAEHDKTKTFVLNLKKIDLKLHTYFDAGGMNGNATMFMRIGLDAALSWDDWKVKHTGADLVQMHIGLQTVAPGPISHWVSGSSYAALKVDDTCDTLQPAFAANWIHGATFKKLTFQQMEQAEANNHCCRLCKAHKDANGNPNCDGFQVSRTDYKKNKVCEFRKPYKSMQGRHFNYKGEEKTKAVNTGSVGDRVGYIDLPGHGKYTQAELDEMCAKGCIENPDCQMWMTTSSNPDKPQCWLQRAYQLDNGLVQGLIRGGIAGQMNAGLKQGMKALMAHMKVKCQAGKC